MAQSPFNFRAIVAAQPPSPGPSLTAVDAAGWGILIAAIAWGGPKLLDWLLQKDRKDDELTHSLIAGLQEDRKSLIEGNQRGFDRVVDAVGSQTVRTSEELRDLNHLIARFSETLHNDVQSTLIKQSNIYVETSKELSKMRATIEQLDKKMDEILKHWKDSYLPK